MKGKFIFAASETASGLALGSSTSFDPAFSVDTDMDNKGSSAGNENGEINDVVSTSDIEVMSRNEEIHYFQATSRNQLSIYHLIHHQLENPTMRYLIIHYLMLDKTVNILLLHYHRDRVRLVSSSRNRHILRCWKPGSAEPVIGRFRLLIRLLCLAF